MRIHWARQEAILRQRSRELWLEKGGQNSKFFRTSVTAWRRRNYISTIYDGRKRIANPEDIKDYFLRNFEEVYESNNLVLPNDLEELRFQQVTLEANENLMQIPSEVEIKEIVDALHPLKAPGPDGFPGIFYRHYWRIIKQNVISCVQESFRTGDISRGLNRSYLVLIPKNHHPTEFNHFRPISLCNFNYNIISKIIAMRMQSLLPQMILLNQGAFVQGRWIADNTVLAQEIVHKVKKFKGKGGLMMAKIDLGKAYDRIKWSFIGLVLKSCGFLTQFRRLIFGCLSSVQYNLLVNGNVEGEIEPSRGLHQGDPLSPYLFILCIEVLSQLLDINGDIQGIKFGKDIPAITHLLYADDLLLVGRANAKSSQVM